MSDLIPRPEYPNPQFERADWVNLNGTWQFEIDHGKTGRERKFYEKQALADTIIVPFCPESELSGIGCKDFMPAVWYRKAVTIPQEKLQGRVFLHFGAVDYEAFLYVNGAFVGSHKGGYTHFSFDITDFVHAGENVVVLCAEDDSRSSMIPSGKQSGKYDSYGCFYTRTTGIWQTVWLEYTPKAYIRSLRVYPNYKDGTVAMQADVCGSGIFKAEAFFDGHAVGSFEAQTDGSTVCGTLHLSQIHLWDVGQGNLYDLKLTFGQDTVKSYFGLRNVRMDGWKFMLNDRSVFMRLVLDQGFYPDGIYTAKDEKELLKDIELSLAAGFNGARLHEKVFEPRFLYYCDKMGYLAWGEYPNWGLDYSDPKAVAAVLPEWTEEIARDFNHPSIIGWCPFNETWDFEGRLQWNELLRMVYRTTKALDPTRPCIDTSGNFHVETDIYDVHNYEQNPETFKAEYDKLMTDNELYDQHHNHRGTQKWNGEPTFVSEYGGIRWAGEEAAGWGYGEAPKTEQEFLERYKGLTDALLDNDKMCGLCYTQLYDVEQEVNGLYTYDRVPKFDMEFFRAVNSRKAAIED